MNWRGIAIEVIHELWSRGFYVQSVLLRRLVDQWFEYWVEYKTKLTMEDVDKQIEELRKIDEKLLEVKLVPVYTEEGNEIRLTAPWYDRTHN